MSDRLKTFLMLFPALVVLGGLFLGGLGVGLWRSLTPGGAPALSAYRAVLTTDAFGQGLALSLYVSTHATALAAVAGVAMALVLRRAFRGRGSVLFLMQMVLTVPHVAGAIGILYLLSQSGSLARLARAAGLIDGSSGFPAMVFDPYAIGIILHYVWKEAPFVGLIVLAALQGQPPGHEDAARSLGAGPWQVFRHITLPAIRPALSGACAIVFAFTFGAYEIPALLGQSHPQALPVMAWRLFTDVDLAARPQAMALAMVIAALSGVAIWVYLRALRGAVGR